MERYKSQLPIPEIGPAGQARLAAASALVVGAGGLGSTLLYCLTGAGVGRLGVADFDRVSESNLNRQFLYTAADIGRKKAEAARDTLSALRPDARIALHETRVDAENAAALIAGYDLVLAAVDNLPARLALNAACVAAGVPLVNGGVDGFCGQVQTVTACSPCLHCTYGGMPPATHVPTSFPPVVSAVSALMAQCALSLLLGLPDPLGGELLFCELSSMRFDRVALKRNPACPVCGKPRARSQERKG